MKKVAANLILTLVVVGLMIFAIFYLMENSLFELTALSTYYLNKVASYQITTLILAFLIVLVTAFQTEFKSISLFSLCKIDGDVVPEPWMGLTKNNKDSWKKVGFLFTITISIVTAIIMYFQVLKSGVIQTLTIGVFVLILLFALINSFVEEVTFRHTFASIVEYHNLNPNISKALSAVIFGAVHYFGVPRGVAGVLLAAFLGWFLSKSIHETKGFFWAWLIHFMQDVIIMTSLYLILK
ncbi:MAG: CPBP family intramembrane metalloprotease [Candidatus Riflebacteria bacterium]|nr:CPBP family intramembrane metalloprotease [Candidatus Riflebacteria bacterium]